MSEESVTRIVHFVGFVDDRYLAAVRVWGKPEVIHRGWDLRALKDIGEDDIVVFANGEHDQVPKVKSFNDIDEDYLLPIVEKRKRGRDEFR